MVQQHGCKSEREGEREAVSPSTTHQRLCDKPKQGNYLSLKTTNEKKKQQQKKTKPHTHTKKPPKPYPTKKLLALTHTNS